MYTHTHIYKNIYIYTKKCLDYNKRRNDYPTREEPDDRQLSTYCTVHSTKSLGTAQNTHKHTFSLSLFLKMCVWSLVEDYSGCGQLISSDLGDLCTGGL